MIDFSVCFFSSNELQTNCLPLLTGHVLNHTELWFRTYLIALEVFAARK